jgi:Zn-dependent protease
MTLALFIELLTTDPVRFISIVVAVVISISLHELGHGITAIWQGDDTPRLTGHMTLDPTVHMPPFSWLLLVLAGISYGLMPVDRTRFRGKYGEALVAAAGPAVNLLLSLLGLTVFALWIKATGGLAEGAVGNFQQFFLFFGTINLVLCLFNLLPVPPLDGSGVLANFSTGYRRLISNPDNGPFFMVAFVLVFIFSDRIWTATARVVHAYLGLFGV